MDMDAWNWASESDWWAHYVLTGDHKSATATQPPLLLVNHEARFESTKAYKQLAIDKAVLKRCLSNETVVDHSLERMRNLKKTPRLNVDNDILEWAHVKRWSRNNPMRCSALFLAASMSVQHVVVEYDHYLHTSLLSLALSVMDVESPLKSLTIKVFDASVQKQITYRISAVPDHVPVIRDQQQLPSILRRRHVGMLPCYRWPSDATENLKPTSLDRSAVMSFAQFFEPGTKLDTNFAIFRVASDDDQPNCEGLVPSPEVVRSWRWVDMVDEQDRTSFNISLQSDVALFMHRISLFEQWDHNDPRRHRIDVIPFHGICNSQHGLP
ncbi:hypothetical protein PFICI_06167 [Pestalotiopsis fici W106-1]|uniref:Uncharacterized protein n=1 Tax=Pestalotiopsis fici (strain W106-1 / CGMCC3.15140) TaxID=1229662 RepID=W3X530_PESFW|nr:uncharacterized protein PFICI_06167 [Pestalotiopsis fici W106-1]ETS81165.1 hypothetical protein PFICI_06167 [Pestalotiopsis fici W106-1]